MMIVIETQSPIAFQNMMDGENMETARHWSLIEASARMDEGEAS